MSSKTNGQLFRNVRMHIDQSIYTHISQNSTWVMTKEQKNVIEDVYKVVDIVKPLNICFLFQKIISLVVNLQ